MPHKKAIVIGAGIVGLATARSLAERGYRVTVFERHPQAISASIRNFGMVWPVGQPAGHLYERAMNSRNIWKTVAEEADLWYDETGSLHLAYTDLELNVVSEIAELYATDRGYRLLSPEETLQKSPAVNPDGLKGALWSPDEMIVESRVAIAKLPAYLADKYDVRFHFNTVITEVAYPAVYSGNLNWEADEIYICSGADFETLYPEVFATNHFTKCKLQMMRLNAQPDNWRIGPSLCGALSLIHYTGFKPAPHLAELHTHFENTLPEYLKWGIHVMVSQNHLGELTVGDSHEYGLHLEPFDRTFINDMILQYFQQFASVKDLSVMQHWNGIYPKRTNGEVDFVYDPEPGVTIINGLGGAGMTLSFGLAEEVIGQGYRSATTTAILP
jgi:FAD dependent oxidoreductase TIGR03364